MRNISRVNLVHLGDCSPNYFAECLTAYWLWRTLPFCLLVIGTAGNILNIAILTQPNLRHRSTSVFLLFLAISDLIVLWSDLLPSVIDSVKGYRIADINQLACRLRNWLPLTCAGFSIWILDLLTIERLLLVKIPTLSSRYVTPKNAFIISVLTVSTIALINSHVLFGLTLVPNDGVGNSTVTDFAVHRSHETRYKCSFVSQSYAYFYEKKWNIVRMVMYAFIPSVLLIIGNINIVVALHMQARRMNRSTGQTPTSRDVSMGIRRKRNLAATKLLLALSLYFLATKFPISVYLTLRGQVAELTDRDVAVWQLLTIIAKIFVWSNSSSNFFFYFVNGSLFKNEWNRLIGRLVTKFQNRVRPMQDT